MEPILKVENLVKKFPVKESLLRTQDLWAVNGVSFSIQPGQVMGLVGESGCGKSTVGRCLVRLETPTSGKILFDGTDVAPLSERAFHQYRSSLQMVFQDPTESLNPRMTARQMISEPLKLHARLSETDQKERVREVAALVGLKDEHLSRYPHQLSTGQQQRIGVARAIATHPKFVVLDEPTSALDVSVRGMVIKLLMDLQEKLGLSYLFISHDLSVIRHICDYIAVMYLGMIVEMGPTKAIFDEPLHPYTRALLAAVPIPDPKKRRTRTVLEGEVPSPINLPPGCFFASRCPFVDERSRTERQVLVDHGGGRFVACYKAAALAQVELAG